VQLQSHAFSTQNPTAAPLGYDTSGPVPYYVVTFDPGAFLDPATVATDGYSYGTSDNRLASIAEAGGHTRAFTHDAAGNVTYDNRSGGGYGYPRHPTHGLFVVVRHSA
jgi:YD repeat-containing protein